MKKSFVLTLAFALSSIFAFAQTKFIEEVKKQGDEVVIPYWKGQLDNGLTLIIHEDHSDPLVHVDVTYHVGSAREEVGKSGFAHFFEHMMFQGSENVADEEHFKIVSESGGTLNGTTNQDRTNYFETLPANQLETALWLESDRMGWLLPAVTQEKFEIQRATVKNEKQQNYDNRPYGLYRELNASALYPYGHPYSWLTIGVLEDLDRVDVTDLRKFFLRWYGPNNATLTIGGDVNREEVIKMVEKYFGDIPRGPEVADMTLDPVVLTEDRYVSYEDANIRFPAIIITFPTVPNNHPDEAPLDCLAEILGRGKTSYFYQKFVKTQKAIQASASHPASELSGEFMMFTLPFPGQTLAQFETEMRNALDEFEKDGVKDEDIERFKSGFESSTINGLATVSGKVSQLAYYETFRNNPNQIQAELKRYANVTKEDVMRVYKKYIKGKNSVIVSVLPKGGGMEPAKPDNFVPQKSGDNPFPTTDYSGLAYKRTEPSFDRSSKPVVGSAPLVDVPKLWKDEVNGIKVIGTKSDEIPTVAISITLPGGQLLEASQPDKAGLAELTAQMMNESTQKRTSEEISLELEKIGSSVSFWSGDESSGISINSLVKNLDKTLEIFQEKLFSPGFKQEEFERLKKQQLEGIMASKQEPASIASSVYYKLLFGENNIRALSSSGTEQTVPNLTLDDVKAFYEKYYTPANAYMVIVGDVDQKEVMKKLTFLNEWKSKPYEIPEVASAPAIEKTKIYLVDKPGAPQSEIRVGFISDLTYDATGEYFRRYLMSYPLGMAFNSRINLNLREDKGWTYGARASYSATNLPGSFTASSGVLGTATDSAVFEIMNELTMYKKDGITPDELVFMKNSIGQRDAREYEAPYQKASFLGRLVKYNLDTDFVKEQSEIIKNISKEEVDKLAAKHLPVDKMVIVVVGDKASVEPGLKRLGYDIVQVDADGKPL